MRYLFILKAKDKVLVTLTNS